MTLNDWIPTAKGYANGKGCLCDRAKENTIRLEEGMMVDRYDEKQLPYYEDRQQEAWEDYKNLVSHRDELLRQCLEQSERIKVLEDVLKEIRGMAAMIGASNIANACKHALHPRATLEVK